jgi:hypothetical protein
MAFQNGWRGPNIVSDGLVFYLDAGSPNSYRSDFRTIWKDISGFNNSGSLINGPTYNTANGGSILFDGLDDYANLESVRTQVLTYTTAVTFDIIFNMSQWVNSSYNGVLVLGRNPDPGGGSQSYLVSSIDVSGLFLAFFGNSDGTRGSTIASPSQIQTNTVYNFTMTYNSGVCNLYQNGSLVSTATNSTSTIYNTNQNNFYIGGDSRYSPGSSGRYFNGFVYNTKIYNRALSASEVLQNYNALKSRFSL